MFLSGKNASAKVVSRICGSRCNIARSRTVSSIIRSTTQSRYQGQNHPSLSPTWKLLLAIFPISLATLSYKQLECSPTYHGSPVAATFLMHQAFLRLEKKFPGLEISAVFDMTRPDQYTFKETGLFASVMPSGCEVEVPLFEKLSQTEEARMGAAGIKKTPVGKVWMRGECSLGCAKVDLLELIVKKNNGEVVWHWKKSS
ncbi:hypothetical protein DFS34DRAFT_576053 [Phlyctochytrium arcticum]|nr:hypothetical protein DFS34DRAFT_576053 [Phlyctochytrium arcticum]